MVSKVKSKIKNRVKQITKKMVYQKNISERLLENSLKEKVDIAYKVIDGIYKNNPKENRGKIVDAIKNALRSIRYNGPCQPNCVNHLKPSKSTLHILS